MKRWQSAFIFVLLGIVCAAVSATIADARFGGPNMKNFLDFAPHETVGSGDHWTWTWRFPGVTYIGRVNAEANPAVYTMNVAAGWPIRSFAASSSVNFDRDSLVASPLRFIDVEPKIVVGSTRIYLEPSWGLAPNAAVYALSLIGIWRIGHGLSKKGRARFEGRRFRRAAAAGRCVYCGYPIGAKPVCSECGSILPRGLAKSAEVSA